MTRSQVYCSSGAFRGVTDVPSVLEHADRLGVENIELASGVRAGSTELPSVLKHASERFNLLLHNYFPAPDIPFVLNLASESEAERAESIAFCRHTMQLCVDAGAPMFTVHAGYVQALRAEDLGHPDRQISGVSQEHYQSAMSRFQQSVTELLQTAEQLNTGLAIENNVHAVAREPGDERPSHVLLATPDSIVEFFTSVEHPKCGLLLDVAHWRVSGHHLNFDWIDELPRVSAWVHGLHLSDNDGTVDSNQPCGPDSWFWEPLEALDLLRRVPVVLEAYQLDDQTLHQQMELLQNRIPNSV